MRSALSRVPAVLLCGMALLIGPAAVSAAAAAPSPASAAAAAPAKKKTPAKSKKKKKPTTAQRVTSLSQSLNRAKAQQRAAQKQLDALTKQQALIGDQISSAVGSINSATALTSAAGILGLLQDPSSGIPQLLDSITAKATAGITALLASQEYAVAVVTVGENVASPTILVSPDISDIGAPVTFSGTVPIVIPPGLTDEAVNVRVGAVSLEDDGTATDPVFYANLNHFSVTPAGWTGNVGDAIVKGGNAGVNITQTTNGGTYNCAATAEGCGAPVWSGPNADFGNLPFWPVQQKLVSFGDQPGVRFDISKMTGLAGGGRLASVTGGSTGPIRVSTLSPKTGVSLLTAEVTLTVFDPSVNPADPLA